MAPPVKVESAVRMPRETGREANERMDHDLTLALKVEDSDLPLRVWRDIVKLGCGEKTRVRTKGKRLGEVAGNCTERGAPNLEATKLRAAHANLIEAALDCLVAAIRRFCRASA